jgi:alpha-L-fucosidase 2
MRYPHYFILLFCLVSQLLPAQESSSFNPATTLWYSAPAQKWEEALPIGNGRIGAMVFGKNGEERIQLNEETYWTGGPYSTVVKGGAAVLPEIQQLVFAGKMLKAHNLFGRRLMGYPVEQQKYQSLANLHLFFPENGTMSEYKRWLDLQTGISGVSYRIGEVTYRREAFVSAPDQVMVLRITASDQKISFKANLRGVRNPAHSNYGTDYFTMDPNGQDGLVLKGRSSDYLGIDGQIRFEAQLKVVAEGGTVRTDDADLWVENAQAVTLYFSAATNFVNYHDVSADPHAKVEAVWKNLQGKTYPQIQAAALKDHQQYFQRSNLQLENTQQSFLPTNERMLSIQTAPDPSLAALCYHFGRYLLIASSRPGTQPANLQGIWNNDMNPAWDSKYTTNINTEMNYWPVETGNLSECLEPLTKMVKELVDQGTQVAREHYGCRGWVFHQNTDLWRVAAPMDGPTWGTFTTGGAWLCTHLWEHYLFTQDREYLREVYPLLQGSVQFFMDFLVETPDKKWLVTNPSTSPENFPASPGNQPYYDEVTGMILPGTTICYGSSIDMQILHDLFGYYTEAAAALQVDAEFAAKVAAARKRLPPPQIGKNGALQEWTEDWDQLEKAHRHYSHLYGLYPGKVISSWRTPQLVEPVKKVLEQRGDESSGWSRAWKMCLWARLYDGNRLEKIFKGYLKDQAYPQLFAKCFTPMQVDGSFGVAAGVVEALVQSHEGRIHLLPALPTAWASGRMEGVCARGGFQLDFSWQNGKLQELRVLSKAGLECRVLPGKGAFQVTQNGKKIKTQSLEDGSLSFATEKGKAYVLKPM